MESIEAAMKVLQDTVRAARKAKALVGASLKGNPFCIEARIPFAIRFAMSSDNPEIVRKMLKAEDIYVIEDGYQKEFTLTDLAEKYPNYIGSAESDKCSVNLWAANPVWG